MEQERKKYEIKLRGILQRRLTGFKGGGSTKGTYKKHFAVVIVKV